MPTHSIAPDPDVVDTELDGHETVLLHLGTKRYFSLNATGGVIWRAVKEGLAADDMSRLLQRQYDVSAEQARQSVTALLDALLTHGLVRLAGEE